jgi:hypothetical protein
MFEITKQATGYRGSLVRLVRLDTDDYTVIVRFPKDARFHHRYMGPDLSKAEEVFDAEVEKLQGSTKGR